MKEERAKAHRPQRFSDAMIEKLPRADKGSRYGRSDSQVPGLRVRVTASGSKTFLVWKRLEGHRFWTTRYLGKFPGMTVDEARTKARAFLTQIEQGLDPKLEAKREARARAERPTFQVVAEAFIAKKLPGERYGKGVERMIRNALLPAWGDLALADIKPRDIAELLHARAATPGHARNLRTLAKRFALCVGPFDRQRPLHHPARTGRAHRDHLRSLGHGHCGAAFQRKARLRYFR